MKTLLFGLCVGALALPAACDTGATRSSMAWLHGEIARAHPAYDFNKITAAEEMPAWRVKVRAKLTEMLQLRFPRDVEFKFVGELPREGYVIRKYEFSVRERLITDMWMLVPDGVKGAKPGSVPAVVCVPGTGASIESLAGEPDGRFNRYPLRNRQAYYYAKAGFVAIALEHFIAGPRAGGNHFHDYGALAQILGVQVYGIETDQMLACIDFLKRDKRIDPKRIAVSGMSLGCFPVMYAAVASDDIAAVVYNDFVASWAMRYVSSTARKRDYIWKSQDMPGFYKWFDDGPDLLAAIAPRPLFLVEDGHGYDCVDKIVRAYRLAQAEDKLKVRRYPKYAADAARPHTNKDLRQVRGLTDEDFLAWSNCDPSQHSFHAEAVLPWLCRAFGMSVEFDAGLRAELARAEQEKEHFPNEKKGSRK